MSLTVLEILRRIENTTMNKLFNTLLKIRNNEIRNKGLLHFVRLQSALKR